MKQTLVAVQRMTYNTRRLQAGDSFDASERDARLLVGLRKAKIGPPPAPARAQPRAEPVRPPEPARPAAPPSAEPEAEHGPYIERLRATARSLDIAVDLRWGARRLESEIASKRGAE